MRPLAITAHYDDMEISAGGTMNRYGGISLVLTPSPTAAPREEAKEAATALGITLSPILIDRSRRLIDKIDTTIKNYGVDTIITCSPHDSHSDHRAAAAMARQAARQAGLNLLYMDHAIPGGYDGTTPKPNMFVTITPTKYDALDCYVSQVEKYGPAWINAVRARDQMYGFQHGVPLAEGFVLADWTL